MRSGRTLDVDRAVILTGSVAARSLETLDVDGVHKLPSEGDLGELRLAVSALASVLIAAMRVRPTGREAHIRQGRPAPA